MAIIITDYYLKCHLRLILLQVFGNLDSIINPCTNLACKLDVRNCTSKTLLGLVGGVCTGRIVTTSPSAKLHSVGRLLQSYPCVEDSNPMLKLLSGNAAAEAGVYMSKVSHSSTGHCRVSNASNRAINMSAHEPTTSMMLS